MLSVTTAQLYGWLAAFLWPFARVAALVATAPVLGSPLCPARVKIGLAALLALLLAATLGPLPAIAPASAQGLLLLAEQVLIGSAMGFAMQIVFEAVALAGEIAGLQMGLGFATLYDPQLPGQVAVVGEYLNLVASLVFLAINGHLLVIAGLAQSFRVFPLSLAPFGAPGMHALLEWGTQIFSFGLLLSLPLLAALLITNLALGILSRAAPQLNIFAVGFPLTILVGFVMLLLAAPEVGPLVSRFVERGLGAMMGIVAAAH